MLNRCGQRVCRSGTSDDRVSNPTCCDEDVASEGSRRIAFTEQHRANTISDGGSIEATLDLEPAHLHLTLESVGTKCSHAADVGTFVIHVQPGPGSQRKARCADMEHIAARSKPHIDPRLGGAELTVAQVDRDAVDGATLRPRRERVSGLAVFHSWVRTGSTG